MGHPRAPRDISSTSIHLGSPQQSWDIAVQPGPARHTAQVAPSTPAHARPSARGAFPQRHGPTLSRTLSPSSCPASLMLPKRKPAREKGSARPPSASSSLSESDISAPTPTPPPTARARRKRRRERPRSGPCPQRPRAAPPRGAARKAQTLRPSQKNSFLLPRGTGAGFPQERAAFSTGAVQTAGRVNATAREVRKGLLQCNYA